MAFHSFTQTPARPLTGVALFANHNIYDHKDTEGDDENNTPGLLLNAIIAKETATAEELLPAAAFVAMHI